MSFLAEIQSLGDKEAERAIQRAQKQFGITTGVRFGPQGDRLLVTVTLYPKVKFWVEDLDRENQRTNRRGITKAEFDATRPLEL